MPHSCSSNSKVQCLQHQGHGFESQGKRDLIIYVPSMQCTSHLPNANQRPFYIFMDIYKAKCIYVQYIMVLSKKTCLCP